MSRSIIVSVATLGVGLLAPVASAAPVSVTLQSYTPGSTGTAGAGLNTAAYTATTDAKFQDWPLNTGGGTNKFARGLSNNDYAASTILPVGPGGGVTFKFQSPVQALANAKEFAIYTGTFLSTSGGFFYGDMQGSISVSDDGTSWRALDGSAVNPLTYTGTTSLFDAPAMSYVWGTGKTAWDYTTGSGKTQAVLDTFAQADYLTPMPDDSLFNGTGTAADRAALRVSTTPSDYLNAFGTTAGGNWFDISNTGLSEIQYLRINVASNAPAIVRLDSVFANAAAVPEPGILGVLSVVTLLMVGRRRR